MDRGEERVEFVILVSRGRGCLGCSGHGQEASGRVIERLRVT